MVTAKRAESRLARRSDDRAHRGRLLDVLAALRLAAMLAVLLVGGGRHGPFLAARDGRRSVRKATDLRGGAHVPGPNDRQGRDARRSILICDRGSQFDCEGFRDWCRRAGIKPPRYGAIGQHGSIAVVERFILTLKDGCTRLLLVPYRRESFLRELALFREWYNEARPAYDVGRPNAERSLPCREARKPQPAFRAASCAGRGARRVRGHRRSSKASRAFAWNSR